MKIFISWSGAQAKALAKLLRTWLPMFSEQIEPWFSDDDIHAGRRWSLMIAEQLNQSDFGIICLTRESLRSSWVMFEAGALAKSLERGTVIPLLYGLDAGDVSGPLTEFQTRKVNKADMFTVVTVINEQLQQPRSTERLKRLYDALWTDFEAELKAIPPDEHAGEPVRSQSEVLEDLVLSVRSLENQVRSVSIGMPMLMWGGPSSVGTSITLPIIGTVASSIISKLSRRQWLMNWLDQLDPEERRELLLAAVSRYLAGPGEKPAEVSPLPAAEEPPDDEEAGDEDASETK